MSFLIILAILPLTASAEFAKTGPFKYQSPDGKVSITTVPAGEPVSGIFITSGPAMSLQEFDLANLSEADTKSVFILFEEKTNRFSEIHVGRRKLSIKGSFTLLLENVRISLSESSGVPYLTVVDDWRAQSPRILGFIGTTDVFNLSGRKALGLLESHNASKEMQQVSVPYSINERYEVLLRDRPLSVDYIGLVVTRENACLEQEAFVVDPISSRKIFLSKEMQTQVSRGLLSGLSEDKRYFDRLIFLKETKESLIAFDMSKSEIVVIQRFPSSKLVCVIRTIKLENLKQRLEQ